MGDIRTRFDIEGEQQYKKAMSDAAAAIKVLNSEQKLAKAQFQNTGNAEKYAADQARILKEKLTQQKQAVAAAEKALKQLNDNGVAKSSKQFQQWQTKLNSAQTSMVQMETELQKLEKDMSGTASQATNVANSFDTMGSHVSGNANKMSDSLASINRKVSFDAVIKGVNSITDSLEKAGSVAARVGAQIWDNITDSASWADDVATMSTRLGMDIEEYQRHQKVFDTVADMTVRDWQNAKRKVQTAVNKPTAEQMDIFRILGVGIRGNGDPRYNNYTSQTLREWEDVFWDLGDKLREKLAQGKITQDQADVYAQALFGKNYDALLPVLGLGKEGFAAALAEQNVVSEESVNKLAELNDELIQLKSDFRDLKSEVLAGVAPELKKAAEVLDGLLTRLMEYLQKPEGQEMLERMGDAVAGLFEDLANIDPESVVQNFVNVFNQLKSGFEWIKNNWGAVKLGLAAIVGTFAVGKVISGATTILNLLNGLHSFAPTSPTVPTTPGTDTTGPTSPDTKPAPGPNGKPITHNDPTKKPTTDDKNPKVPFDPYSLVPLAVLGVSLAPALIAQNESIEATRETQKKLDAAAKILKEAGSENAEFVERASAAMGLVKNPDGTEAKNIIGMSYTQMSDEYGDLLMGLQSRQGAERAKLEMALQGKYAAGWHAWSLLNRYWNEQDLDPNEVHELLSVVTNALKDQWENGVGTGMSAGTYRRELQNGWTYDEKGNIRRIDANGNLGNYLTSFGEAGYGGTAYWDDRMWQKWFDEENGNIVNDALKQIQTDLKESAEESKNASKKMEEVPEKVANAVESGLSRITFVVGGGGSSGSGSSGGWALAPGGGMGANYAYGLGDHLLNHWGYANGLPYVPFNGYPAILHKGERVLTARANRNYTANSNLYVENMNMNNGMDVRALTDAMERQNRRVRAGFGS